MQNIKVVNLNKNKKYKLQKLMTFALISTLSISTLTGCFGETNKKSNTSNPYKYSSSYSVSSDYKTNTKSQTITQYQTQLGDEELKKIISSKINLSSKDISELENYVSTIDVDYLEDNLFSASENLNRYYNLKKYNSSVNNIFLDNKISGDIIYKFVIENNEKENFSDVAKISNTDLLRICNEIANSLNYIVSMNNNIDLNLLSEKITNLKIKKFSGFSNGSYDPAKGIMGFDVEKINMDSDLFEKVVTHETVHLAQAGSQNEIASSIYDSRFGCAYRFQHSSINSLDWSWFYEGTAEEIMMKKSNSDEALTYNNLIRIIKTIKSATILNPNNNSYSFEQTSLTNDLNNLFDYFNCKSSNDKEEIIKMMLSYELISGLTGSSSAKEFYESYEKINGEMDYYKKKELQTNIKGSIAQTLSKQFYINLGSSMENKNIELIEVFELISVFESEMNKLTWYATSGYTENLGDFINNYVNIQDKFFEILSSKTSISIEDLKDAYILYNSKYSYNLNNISFLTNEKNEYYEKIKIEVQKDKTKSIMLFDSRVNNKIR